MIKSFYLLFFIFLFQSIIFGAPIPKQKNSIGDLDSAYQPLLSWLIEEKCASKEPCEHLGVYLNGIYRAMRADLIRYQWETIAAQLNYTNLATKEYVSDITIVKYLLNEVAPAVLVKAVEHYDKRVEMDLSKGEPIEEWLDHLDSALDPQSLQTTTSDPINLEFETPILPSLEELIKIYEDSSTSTQPTIQSEF